MMPHGHVNARKIMAELSSKGYILQCSMKDLRSAIEQTRGSDNRTIKKWTKFLVDNGYMRVAIYRMLEIV